eukprot:COSAG02_NODE_2689_length_8234_cov_3.337185_7_plen_283_part_00
MQGSRIDAVDAHIEVRTPGADSYRSVLVATMTVGVAKGTNFVADHASELMCDSEVEGCTHRGRGWEDRGAARNAVDGVADGAEAMQALSVPVVSLPARDFGDRAHLIIGLTTKLVLRHERQQVRNTLGGCLGVVTEGQLLRCLILARHPVRHAARASDNAACLSRRWSWAGSRRWLGGASRAWFGARPAEDDDAVGFAARLRLVSRARRGALVRGSLRACGRREFCVAKALTVVLNASNGITPRDPVVAASLQACLLSLDVAHKGGGLQQPVGIGVLIAASY